MFIYLVIINCGFFTFSNPVHGQTYVSRQSYFYREDNLLFAAREIEKRVSAQSNFFIMLGRSSVEEVLTFVLWLSHVGVTLKDFENFVHLVVINYNPAEISMIRDFEFTGIRIDNASNGYSEDVETALKANFIIEKDGYLRLSADFLKSIDVLQHDLTESKEFEMQFDLIIINNVLMHYDPDERMKILKNLSQIIRQTGSIVLEKGFPSAPRQNPFWFGYEEWYRQGGFQSVGLRQLYPPHPLRGDKTLVPMDFPILKYFADKYAGKSYDFIFEFLEFHGIDKAEWPFQSDSKNAADVFIPNWPDCSRILGPFRNRH